MPCIEARSLASVIAAQKIPNPIPARPALCFLNSWACRRIKPLCLHSLSYGSCSAQSRQGQTLRAFPMLEGKTLRGISLGARGSHRKKTVMSIFLCWREKALAKGGTCKGGLTWFSTWYQGVEKEAQGGLSGRQAEVRHALSKAPPLFQEPLLGVLLPRTRGAFRLEQRRSSGSFFGSLQHRLEAWSQSCREEDRSEKGQWLGDTWGKSRRRSFQPLASNELRAAKIYNMPLSILNLLV